MLGIIYGQNYLKNLYLTVNGDSTLSKERGGGGDMAATTSGITLTWLASKACCVTDVAGLAVANVADRVRVVTGREDGVLGISSEIESSTNPIAMWIVAVVGEGVELPRIALSRPS